MKHKAVGNDQYKDGKHESIVIFSQFVLLGKGNLNRTTGKEIESIETVVIADLMSKEVKK